ncbi:MAG: hypothetical protein CVU44_20930 [Chloroflexi bacterium HGW-Chloroflexi-6]|nr:MAG: hypothetical protein CVU44_20930 [Chloroflexi bacterium HGW-Chloroflexi-6]
MILGAILFVFAALVALFGLGLLVSTDLGVPDIDAAADVMGERLFLDGMERKAADEMNQAKLLQVKDAREALEKFVVSQGFHNDDSSRWLPGGRENYMDALRKIYGSVGGER